MSNERTSLVGRYLKALIDSPFGGKSVKKGEYGKIIKYGKVNFPNFESYSAIPAVDFFIRHPDQTNYKNLFELMPEGFNPNQKTTKTIDDFEVGKYYVCSEWDHNSIAKLKELTQLQDGNYLFEFSEGYSNYENSSIFCTDFWFIYNLNNLRLATQEEIDKYIPKTKESKPTNCFNKGDYIVQLRADSIYKHLKQNHIYKQRESDFYLRPELDCLKYNDNGWKAIQFNDKKSWRYATQKEIDLYNEIKKPFNVLELDIVKKEKHQSFKVTLDNQESSKNNALINPVQSVKLKLFKKTKSKKIKI